MHDRFPDAGDRDDLREPVVDDSDYYESKELGYDAVVSGPDDGEADIPDGLPADVTAEATEADSSPGTVLAVREVAETRPWLSKVDINTTLEDVLTRPSVLNPFPEKAVGGGIQVSTISEPTGNPHFAIKYPATGTGAFVELPIGNAVAAEDADEPVVLDHEAVDGATDEFGMRDERWMSVDQFWGGLSADLAHTHLLQADGQEAVSQVKQLVLDNADPDASGDTGYGSYINPNPEQMMRAGLAAAKNAIEEGHAARGYAIASETLRGFSYYADNGSRATINNTSTYMWQTDKDGMAGYIFPEFAESWRELPRGRVDSMADSFHVGKDVAAIVKGRVLGEAVDAWLRTEASNATEAAVEKVALRRQQLADEAQTAEASLRERLEVAGQIYPITVLDAPGEYTWQHTEDLGDYIMRRLTS